MTVTFEAFLESAWSDHADRPQEVADRVASSFHLVQAPEHFAPFVRLLVHVYGEHLGHWQQGIQLLESLRQLPAFDSSSDVTSSIRRSIAALRYASGASDSLNGLSVEDRVCVLASASSALAGRQEIARAIGALSEAIRTAQPGLPSGSPGNRALAAGGNNLAATLEEKPDRSAFETDAMITAAEAGLKYWKLAGTWLEEERAEYRLARTLLEADQPSAAIEAGKRCVAVCDQNDAPPFEQFFAHAVLGLAYRGAGDTASFESHRRMARTEFDRLPQDERKWCEGELAELGD
jgi:hypothetical protein